MSEFDADRMRVRLARDLREIGQLALDLHWQVYASADDHEMPGGRALNMAAPAAVIQDWEATYEAIERDRLERDDPFNKRTDHAADQHAENEQPLNVLTFWTRVIREERDQPTSLKPTISREIDYLRKSLDWVTRVTEYGDPEWTMIFEYADELRGLVRAMQNLLSVGDRLDTSASACFQTSAEGERCGGTLARVNLRRRDCPHVELARKFVDEPGYVSRALKAMLVHFPHIADEHKGCDQGGRDDVYRCLKCEKMYTTAEYWLAVRDNYERQVAG